MTGGSSGIIKATKINLAQMKNLQRLVYIIERKPTSQMTQGNMYIYFHSKCQGPIFKND